MKKNLCLFIMLLFFSCNEKNDLKDKKNNFLKTNSISKKDSQNTSNWIGTYKGIVPCADCKGIKMELTLNKNSTYTLKTEYLSDLKENKFIESGKFIWENQKNKIKLIFNNELFNYEFLVRKNILVLLDHEGNEIKDTKLSKMYILKKSVTKK